MSDELASLQATVNSLAQMQNTNAKTLADHVQLLTSTLHPALKAMRPGAEDEARNQLH